MVSEDKDDIITPEEEEDYSTDTSLNGDSLIKDQQIELYNQGSQDLNQDQLSNYIDEWMNTDIESDQNQGIKKILKRKINQIQENFAPTQIMQDYTLPTLINSNKLSNQQPQGCKKTLINNPTLIKKPLSEALNQTLNNEQDNQQITSIKQAQDIILRKEQQRKIQNIQTLCKMNTEEKSINSRDQSLPRQQFNQLNKSQPQQQEEMNNTSFILQNTSNERRNKIQYKETTVDGQFDQMIATTSTVAQEIYKNIKEENFTQTNDSKITNQLDKLLKTIQLRARDQNSAPTYQNLKEKFFVVYEESAKNLKTILYAINNRKLSDSFSYNMLLEDATIAEQFQEFIKENQELNQGKMQEGRNDYLDSMETFQQVSLGYSYTVLSRKKDINRRQQGNAQYSLENVIWAFYKPFQFINMILDPLINQSIDEFIEANTYRSLLVLAAQWLNIKMKTSIYCDQELLCKIEEKVRQLEYQQKINENQIRQIVGELINQVKGEKLAKGNYINGKNDLNNQQLIIIKRQMIDLFPNSNIPQGITYIFNTFEEEMDNQYKLKQQNLVAGLFIYLLRAEVLSTHAQRVTENRIQQVLKLCTTMTAEWSENTYSLWKEVVGMYQSFTQVPITYLTEEGITQNQEDCLNWIAIRTFDKLITKGDKKDNVLGQQNKANRGSYQMKGEIQKDQVKLPLTWETAIPSLFEHIVKKEQIDWTPNIKNQLLQVFKEFNQSGQLNVNAVENFVQNSQSLNNILKEQIEVITNTITWEELKMLPKKATMIDLAYFNKALEDTKNVMIQQSKTDDESTYKQLGEELFEKIRHIDLEKTGLLLERGQNTRVKSYETLSALTIQLTALHNANLRLRCKALCITGGVINTQGLSHEEVQQVNTILDKSQQNYQYTAIRTLQEFVYQYQSEKLNINNFKQFLEKLVSRIPTFTTQEALSLAAIMNSSELENIKQQSPSAKQYISQQGGIGLDFEISTELPIQKVWEKCLEEAKKIALPKLKNLILPMCKLLLKNELPENKQMLDLKKAYYANQLYDTMTKSDQNLTVGNLLKCQIGLEPLSEYEQRLGSGGWGFLKSIVNKVSEVKNYAEKKCIQYTGLSLNDAYKVFIDTAQKQK